MKVLHQLISNEVLWSMTLSFVIAQTIKGLLKLDVKEAFSYGGMPSGHAALVVGMSISIGLNLGFNSPLFAFAVGFSMIVFSDAVRFRPKVDKKMGHTWAEVFVGGAIGLAVAIILHMLLNKL